MSNNKLIRGLGLKEATALNMIDMVGIGPFVTIPLIISAMNGPQCILAWVLGAVLALSDGFVWSELGAAMPEAGGSYVFLRELYGRNKWGSLMSFLFIWQTVIQAPLVIASGAIGFSQYLGYLFPNDSIYNQQDSIIPHLVSGALVILLVFLLYRNIKDIGKISLLLWIVVIGTIGWLIVGGLMNFHSELAFNYPEKAFELSPVFFAGLGLASVKTIYSYLGYYNVCHLGAEIKNPQKNIPRSIFISIIGIAILYLLMQLCILGVIPWQTGKESKFIVSLFFENIYGKTAAIIATILILWIAMASLFSALLGYSRVPYSAAADGKFFSIFAKIHPTKNFPHISLLILGATAFIFSLFFKLKDVITAIIVMRILVQFVGQSIGVILLRYRKNNIKLPFKMWLFPVPAIIGIIVWMFVFFSTGWKFELAGIGIIFLGIIIFHIRAVRMKEWTPFRIKN
jgi:fructoselysine transporter